jgi:hypothetical protein
MLLRLFFFTPSFFAPVILIAQRDSLRTWEISTSISYGSENNYGNPGLMLVNNYEYHFSKLFSSSYQIGFFHSLPLFHPSGFYYSFSSFQTGFFINHYSRFGEGKKFVRTSAGINYFHANYLSVASNTETESISKLGYGLSLEGGAYISKKTALGLCLNIYSFQIFGDIIVLGLNTRFKL